MNLPIVIGVILYEVIVIIGVSAWLNARAKRRVTGGEFVQGGGNLGPVAVGATMALTSLGGAHILGMPGQATGTGIATYWFTMASGMMMIILCCYVGPWYKRFGFTTVSGMFENLYNRKVAVLLSAMTAGCTWGVITLEIQGVGIVIASMTGWNLVLCCIVGGIIAYLYVVFAGMKEVAWVNVINAIFMYLGVFIATYYLGKAIDGGWGAVNDFYIASDRKWMLSLFANGETWKVYILGAILGNLFFVPMNQAGCQCSIAAKNVKTLKRCVWIAVPLNVVFGIFTIAYGMAAASMPEYALGRGPIDTFMMLVDLLPTWVLIWLLSGFVAAILSTVAVCVLALATVFVDGVMKQYYRADMSDRDSVRYLRIAITGISVLAMLVSILMPSINTSMIWLFSWLLPPFWMFVFGMHWKRSNRAAMFTIIFCALINCIWSFFPQVSGFLNLPGSTNAIVMLVFVMIVGSIAVAGDRNAKEPLVKLYKTDKTQFINKEAL